jgi:hypothetical protein
MLRGTISPHSHPQLEERPSEIWKDETHHDVHSGRLPETRDSAQVDPPWWRHLQQRYQNKSRSGQDPETDEIQSQIFKTEETEAEEVQEVATGGSLSGGERVEEERPRVQ